ncbi:MAG: hypothetical protein MZU91_05865 [Desulfosudis oleivorans]|nr:hypothetical protein [Desulfosudis oleivorans]
MNISILNKKAILYFAIILIFLLLNIFSLKQAYASDFGYGIQAYNQNNFFLAEKYFKRGMKLNQINHALRYYLAITLIKNNKFAEAEKESRTIIAKSPDSEAGMKARQGLSYLINDQNADSQKVVVDIANHKSSLILKNVILDEKTQNRLYR